MPAASGRRVVKFLALACGALLVLAAAALALVAAGAGSGLLKGELARVVQEQKGRTLRIDGELSWSLFPGLALRLGQASLSEHESEQVFASLDGARVSLQFMPLLRGQVVIDSVEAAGLRANLVRLPDGRFNIDDLLARDPRAAPARFDIGALKLTAAHLAYRDEKTGQAFALSGLGLDTGRLANAAEGRLALAGRFSGAGRALHVALAAHYRYDLDGRRYGAPTLELELAGIEPRVQARLVLSDFEATNETLKAGRAALELDLRQGETAVAGGLASALAADLGAQTVELPAFTGELSVASPRLPMRRLKLPLSGGLRVDLGRQTAAGRVAAQIDESQARASFAIARFSPLRLTFELDVDRLDLDRYLPAKPGGEPSGPALAPALLQGLNASGTVRIGELKTGELTARNLRLEVQAADGRLDVRP